MYMKARRSPWRHAARRRIVLMPKECMVRAALLGIHYRGVQWEGGAVDGGSLSM